MEAIILFSHGSLLCGSVESLTGHATRLRSYGIAPIVEVGYLNYSDPKFSQAVCRCVASGATRIIIAPYFLVPGYFVRVDLPKCVEKARADHPTVEFVVGEPIGYDDRLADAIIASASDSADPDGWWDDLKRAASACRSTSECPLYDTRDCPLHPGEGVAYEAPS